LQEFVSAVLPQCPASQVRSFVVRLAPELDIEGKSDPVDLQAREQLLLFGEPEQLPGETKAERRMR
jgi:hypothetical protein